VTDDSNIIPFPGFSFSRARQEIADAFTHVRVGRTELWAAQAKVLAALDAFEEHQRRVREAHNATVSATGEGKVVRDPRMTSAKSAASVAPRVGTQRAAILTHIAERPGGVTDFEIARDLKILPNSVRPRRGELIEGGYVVDSGQTRVHRGSEWVVWKVSADGREWFDENRQENPAA
jgi:hypothetical protein